MIRFSYLERFVIARSWTLRAPSETGTKQMRVSTIGVLFNAQLWSNYVRSLCSADFNLKTLYIIKDPVSGDVSEVRLSRGSFYVYNVDPEREKVMQPEAMCTREYYPSPKASFKLSGLRVLICT